ncbi:MAG: DUF4870 domain-containing protein [Thermoflexales bacterium]|nr:DUF4870 domain-containing protein [Thermoflexales bacterium]
MTDYLPDQDDFSQELPDRVLLPEPGAAGVGPLSRSDEQLWAMLAHLSALVNLFTGFLGPLVALAIYLIYKDRSRYVAYQSLQSFFFQLICWFGGGLLIGMTWLAVGVLSIIVVGLFLIPVACLFTLLPLVSLAYSVWGGVECSQGRDFRYWLVGDWVRSTFERQA